MVLSSFIFTTFQAQNIPGRLNILMPSCARYLWQRWPHLGQNNASPFQGNISFTYFWTVLSVSITRMMSNVLVHIYVDYSIKEILTRLAPMCAVPIQLILYQEKVLLHWTFWPPLKINLLKLLSPWKLWILKNWTPYNIDPQTLTN